MWDGLGKLGYERGLIRRNVNGCANLGYCGMGCPIDAKQSMLVTVLPDAVEKGLRLFANVSVRKLEWQGRKVTKVIGQVLDPVKDSPNGRTVVVTPKVTAVCGGAINSPALLLRSGLDADGRVGRRTWLHPVAVMMALFDEPVNAFQGAPQSVFSHQFIERGAWEDRVLFGGASGASRARVGGVDGPRRAGAGAVATSAEKQREDRV